MAKEEKFLGQITTCGQLMLRKEITWLNSSTNQDILEWAPP
jgi:hypothetical protein